jgi:hypothetical protein
MTPEEESAARKSRRLNRAGVVVALVGFFIGLVLLWGVWEGPPVAAAFTRVGGASRVETALEAARFWLTPPQYVVETQTRASKVMLMAAQCAVVHDAPLLFTSPDPKQQREVEATINDWRVETPKGVALPEASASKGHHDLAQVIDPVRPQVIMFPKDPKKISCKPKAKIAGLSTLKVPDPLMRFPHVRSEPTLAQFVVFAAAIEPGHPPDVAVGLALAAHMARADGEPVSLVVVPHYLESDVKLEKKLERQHELVAGGVVLGQTPTVPEETRVLLRQLLAARNERDVLAQLQGDLGSAGTLIGALLALVGLAAATRSTIRIRELTQKIKSTGGPGPEPIINIVFTSIKHVSVSIGDVSSSIKERIVTVKQSDWLYGLGKDKDGKDREVTVWLRSGRQVAGIIESQIPPKTRDATVFRIRNSSLAPSGGPPSQPRPDGNYVLVWVKDIEQIYFNDSKNEAAKVSQTSP